MDSKTCQQLYHLSKLTDLASVVSYFAFYEEKKTAVLQCIHRLNTYPIF